MGLITIDEAFANIVPDLLTFERDSSILLRVWVR